MFGFTRAVDLLTTRDKRTKRVKSNTIHRRLEKAARKPPSRGNTIHRRCSR